MKNIKILIVDDNPYITESYELTFKKEWFDVATASDWSLAEKKLKKFNPDIILLDIMMPKVNWFSFLEKVRKTDTDTKIILNSNLSQDSDIEKWLALWATKYFRKSSFTPLELVNRIKKLFDE